MSKIPWENLMLTTSDKGMTRNDENENEEASDVLSLFDNGDADRED